jgi:hypothetical protein
MKKSTALLKTTKQLDKTTREENDVIIDPETCELDVKETARLRQK